MSIKSGSRSGGNSNPSLPIYLTQLGSSRARLKPPLIAIDKEYFHTLLISCHMQRYYIWKEAQAKVQSSVWTDPRGYYFLNIMVVVPEAQGKGVGRQLMKAVTGQADAEGMNCYLESSRDRPNMQIYGRFGFRFAKELECDDEGTAIKLFAMVREPNASPRDN